MIIKNKLYLLFIFINVFLALYSVNFYQGSKIIYLIYSLSSLCFFIYLTNPNSFYFENFLAFYFYLGYWLSFTIKISFFESNFVDFSDGFGNFDFLNKSFDKVLIICISSFLSIIFASYIRRKYCNYSILKYQNLDTTNLNKFNEKKLFLFLFIFILIICSINYYFSIFQRGGLSNPNINIFLVNFSKWFLTFGYITLFCFFLNYFKKIKKNNFSQFQIYIYLISEFLISLSILSRGLIFNGLSILWGLKNTFQNISLKKFITPLIVLIFIFILNIFVVSDLRIKQITKDVDLTTKIEIKQKINDNRDFFDKLTTVLISRLHGFEAIMAVEGNNDKSFNFFLKSLKTKTGPNEISFFDKMKNDERQNTFSNISLTLPGLLAFLYFSGSVYFVIFILIILIITLGFVEKLVFNVTKGNIIFMSFIGNMIAYRLWHFGHNPSNTYLFILSIVLSCFFIIFLKKLFK